MATIPYGLIGSAVDAAIAAVKGSSKKDEEKKPEEKKPAEEKPKQEPKKAYKKGGRVMKNEGMMEKKMGKGMAKADMQKVATGAVKKHEKSMHGMKSGGMACGGKTKKYAKGGSIDGCATKGKTKGRMI